MYRSIRRSLLPHRRNHGRIRRSDAAERAAGRRPSPRQPHLHRVINDQRTTDVPVVSESRADDSPTAAAAGARKRLRRPAVASLPVARHSAPTAPPPTSSYPPTTYCSRIRRPPSSQREPSLITGSPNGAPAQARRSRRHAPNDRARFSGKRLALEIIGGGLIGGVTSALVFNATCNGRDCLGASLLSFGADFAVTPLTVYEIGHLMGGRGSPLSS
jgi:hypothetical protein